MPNATVALRQRVGIKCNAPAVGPAAPEQVRRGQAAVEF